MADDRRQQLGDVLRTAMRTQLGYGPAMQTLQLEALLPALLPLLDRVAADAAAEALEQAAWELNERADRHAAIYHEHKPGDAWSEGTATGLDIAVGLVSARAAAHRTPAPSSEENARG